MNVKYFKIALLAFFLGTYSSNASADTGRYLIDFGVDVSTTTNTGWNNYTETYRTNTNYILNLVDSAGSSTPVNFKFVTPFDCGSNNLGATNNLDYPANATVDFFYAGQCSHLSTSAVITGLDPLRNYSVKLFTSRLSAGNQRRTILRVGPASAIVDADNNVSNYATISSIALPSSGNLDVYFERGDAGQFFYLNTLEIVSDSKLPPVVNAGPDITITSPQANVSLAGLATDSDGTIASTTWEIYSGPGGSFSATTSLSTALSGLYPGRYNVKLSATDNDGIIRYDFMTINVLPQNIFYPANSKKIAWLGGSIATGFGSSPATIENSYPNGYAPLYGEYVKLFNPANSIINFGVGGYTSANIASTTGPNGIGAAIAANPDIVVIAFSTNDAGNGLSTSTSIANLQSAVTYAANAGKIVYVATPTGRSNISLPQMNNLIYMKNYIMNTYGSKALDIWTPVTNPDGTIISAYNSDGTHPNTAGYHAMYNQLVLSGLIEAQFVGTSTPPSSISTLSGDSVGSLTWSVPTFSGYVPVSFYSIYDSQTGLLLATTTSLFYSFPGLANGNTYSYYITATNNIGQSASSSVVTIAPLTALVSKPYSTPGSTSAGSYGIPASLLPFVAPSAASAGQSNAGGLSASITSASFSRSLSSGMSGLDVKALQRYLNARGFPVALSGAGSKGKETGLFGSATKAALARFQKANGIPATGFFGPVTRAAIK